MFFFVGKKVLLMSTLKFPISVITYILNNSHLMPSIDKNK